MTLEKLLAFIKGVDVKLKEQYQGYSDRELILARTVKLAEEFGELCNDVLVFNNNQRKDKLEKHDKNNMEGEFADVLIVTLLLAQTMNVDIKEALKKKVEKINKRFES